MGIVLALSSEVVTLSLVPDFKYDSLRLYSEGVC